MKYSSGRGVAAMMGDILAARVPRPVCEFLTPIPLHKGSEREYNQAEVIALGASLVWGIPVSDCLEWRTRSRRQVLAGNRILPKDAMRAVFAPPRGTRVFLTDDVYTTGNTLRAASRALGRVGAEVAGAVVWSKSGLL
jgi:predicted amidophosphoribosyltransferase